MALVENITVNASSVSYLGTDVASALTELLNSPRLYLKNYPRLAGESDDTLRLSRLHAACNAAGAVAEYTPGTVLEVVADANIQVRTSIVGNGAILRPVTSATPNYLTVPTLAFVGNSAENVTSKINLGGMRKGEMALYGGMTAYSRGTFWMDTRDPLSKRQVAEATPTYYKTTINRISKYGALEYPLEHNFTSSPSPEAYFRPDESSYLVVQGLHIDTSSMSTGVALGVQRSQVVLDTLTTQQDSNVKQTNIRQLVYLGEGVSQIVMRNFSSEAMSAYNSTSGTYLLGSNYACSILLDNVSALQGWGAVGLNKSRGLRVVNSTLNRVDGHYHLFDVDVSNSALYEFGVLIGMGGGYLRVTNVTKYLGAQTDLSGTSPTEIDKTRRSVVYMRDDYGSYFDGDITCTNITYKMGRELTFGSASETAPGILSVVSFNAGVSTTSSFVPDYGFTNPVPWGTNITIKNVVFDIANTGILDSWLTCTGINYNGNYLLPAVLMPASITVEGMRYSTPPRVAKIAPVILPDLRGTVAAVASTNKRIFWNCFISIKDIQSGFLSTRASSSSNTGVQSLMCMYTQSEIAAFPTPSVVPHVSVEGFYGFSGQFSIPGRLSIKDSTVISCTDSSGGRNSDSFISINGGYVYALPNSTGGTASQLPRAEWNAVRFINSPVAPNLTDYDACTGCTFENGNAPVGITAALAYSGSLGDAANRLQ